MKIKTTAILLAVTLLAATLAMALENESVAQKVEQGNVASTPLTVTIEKPKAADKTDKITTTKYGTLFVYTKLPQLLRMSESQLTKYALYPFWDRSGLYWFIKTRCYTVEKVDKFDKPIYIFTDQGRCINTKQAVDEQVTEDYILEGIEKIQPMKGYNGASIGSTTLPVGWWDVPFKKEVSRIK